MVFQDPYDSLNPRRTAGETVLEPLSIHGIAKGDAALDRTAEIFERVGLKTEHMSRFPHQLSGGQQQRVGIARALATNPVADRARRTDLRARCLRAGETDPVAEGTAARNRTDLSLHLARPFGHRLSLDRVAVMYLGQIIELGPTKQVFSRPRHPYTMALMSAIPAANPLGTPRANHPHRRDPLADRTAESLPSRDPVPIRDRRMPFHENGTLGKSSRVIGWRVSARCVARFRFPTYDLGANDRRG